MYVTFPSQGEVYHIRLVLTERRGMVSFEDPRTVVRLLCHTFCKAAGHLGIIYDNNEWSVIFDELALLRTGYVLRELCAIILSEGVADRLSLWGQIADRLSNDLINRVLEHHFTNGSDAPHYDFALFLVNQSLRKSGRKLTMFGILLPTIEWHQYIHPNSLIAAEMDWIREDLAAKAAAMMEGLNEGQSAARLAIMPTLDHDASQPVRFLLTGPGGTGKT